MCFETGQGRLVSGPPPISAEFTGLVHWVSCRR